MKKPTFPSTTSLPRNSGSFGFSTHKDAVSLRIEKDLAEKEYQEYLSSFERRPLSDKEIYECDHCSAPWLCMGVCLKNQPKVV